MPDDEFTDSIEKVYKALALHEIKARFLLALNIAIHNPKDLIDKIKSKLK